MESWRRWPFETGSLAQHNVVEMNLNCGVYQQVIPFYNIADTVLHGMDAPVCLTTYPKQDILVGTTWGYCK